MDIASRKWIAVIADILAFEAAHWGDDQLMSSAAHRFVDRYPIAARIAIVSAGALLTAHLAKVLDPQVDVLSRGFWLWNRV